MEFNKASVPGASGTAGSSAFIVTLWCSVALESCQGWGRHGPHSHRGLSAYLVFHGQVCQPPPVPDCLPINS